MKYFIIKRKRAFLRMPFFVNDTRSSATPIIHENRDSATNIIDRMQAPREIANFGPISSLEINILPELRWVSSKKRTWHVPCYPTEKDINTLLGRGREDWLCNFRIILDETVGLDWTHSARSFWNRDNNLPGLPC
jgi:hypothetical protein